MSTIATNQSELYHAIHDNFAKLLADYQRIPAEMSRDCGIEGHIKNTHISASDTLAYLIGWGRLVLRWHHYRSQGLYVDMPEVGFKWDQLGMLALHFYHQYQTWQYQDLLAELEATTAQILHLVDSLDEEALYGVNWYNKWTLGRVIQFNTASPMRSTQTKVRCFMHHQQII